MDQVSDIGIEAEAERALALVRAGLDQLCDAGIEPTDSHGAAEWIRELESCRRRLDAARADLAGHIQQHGLHGSDGHSSAATMLRHVGKLSAAEAAGVARTARAMRSLPTLAQSYRRGEVGVEQMRLVGRVNANPRIADFIAEHDEWFTQCAVSMPYRDFEAVARQWERLVDVDGARDRNERNHQARDFQLRQDSFDLSWSSRGQFGALQGASFDEIFQRYDQAEWEADWQKARAEHGDRACEADLARTPAQRRADALWQMAQDAAKAPGSAAAGVVHNIVWNAESYETMLASLDSGESPRLDPLTHRCSTLDGILLEPTEAAVHSLTAALRRVVVDAQGTVIDLGRARRFTGLARLAAQLNSIDCVWPGCHRRSSRCEIDHLTEHSRGGRTCPGNGAPLCGRHNRLKQRGFSVWRDPAGTWHTARPDGSMVN